jgi:hypothetical protein
VAAIGRTSAKLAIQNFRPVEHREYLLSFDADE